MKIKETQLTLPEIIHRGHFLYFAYYSLYTIYMDYRIAGCSLQKNLVCNSGEEIYPVQSASYRILRCLIRELEFESSDVVVDIGCGWGRLLGYLLEKGDQVKELYGIEINEQAATVACHIFQNNPRVHIFHADAVKLYIPSATVLLLFNPFGAGVLENFLDAVEKQAAHPIRIYYIHAVYESVFAERKNRWKLHKRQLLQPKHHIPVVLCEYELICHREGQNHEVSEKPQENYADPDRKL